LLGGLPNGIAPAVADNSPFLDLIQRPKAADADEVIVQAAIAHARGLRGIVDVGHWHGVYWTHHEDCVIETF
jgi:hypothetical protein